MGEDGPKGLKALEELCVPLDLFVFIGNGEPIGQVRLLAPAPDGIKSAIFAQQKKSQASFYRAINQSLQDIKRGLSKNDCLKAYDQLPDYALSGTNYTLDEIKSAFVSGNRGRTLLVAITDGPGHNDSKIETTWYGFQTKTTSGAKWTKTFEGQWMYNHRTDQLVPGDGPFELNLAKSIHSIILRLSRMNDQGVLQEVPFSPHSGFRNGIQYFDQTTYVIKTHGGLTKSNLAATPNLFDREDDANGHPILLFDSHGPKGKLLGSDLYIPFWYKSSACQLYKDPDLQTKDNQALLQRLYKEEGCDDTASFEEAPTAGVDGMSCNTAGTGKSQILHHNQNLPLPGFHKTPDASRPDGILTLGEAVTYTKINPYPKGIYPLKLLAGSKERAVFSADMVVLDSCHGSDKINAIFNADKELDNDFGHTITITSPNPLYYDLIRYNLLSASDYRMFNRIMVSEYAKFKNQLIDHLAGGLDASHDPRLNNPKYKLLNIDVILKGPRPTPINTPQTPSTANERELFAQGRSAGMKEVERLYKVSIYLESFYMLKSLDELREQTIDNLDKAQECSHEVEAYCEGWAAGVIQYDLTSEFTNQQTERGIKDQTSLFQSYEKETGIINVFTEEEQKAFEAWWISKDCPVVEYAICPKP